MIRALAAACLAVGALTGPATGNGNGPPQQINPPPAFEPTREPDARTQAACEAAGGTYGRFGLARVYICQLPTEDGGQACMTAADCTGLCLAETMTCSKVVPLFGCHAIVTDAGTRVTICID